MDTLVLHETREVALETLHSVFAQESGIEIISHGSVFDFNRDSSLGAIVLSPAVAYELYGGKGISDEYHQDNHLGRPVLVSDVQIIDSHQSSLNVAQTPIPWIVTYPGFKVRIVHEVGPDGDVPNVRFVTEDEALTTTEMIYVEFVCMFEHIAEANVGGLTPPIRRLGVSTEGLFPTIYGNDFTTVATAVRRAYGDYRHTFLQR